MKCTNCSKTIPDDSKFCEHCGQKISSDETNKTKGNKKLEPSELSKKILDHLEFLAYEISPMEAYEQVVGGQEKYIVGHKSRSKFVLTFAANYGFSLASFFTLDKEKIEKDRLKMLEILNTMNNQAMICSFSLTNDNSSLVCGAWYPLDYSKKSFNEFIEIFENDIRGRLQTAGLNDFS